MSLDQSHQAFITRLQRAGKAARKDKSLRWNQCDVVDTTVAVLKAKPGDSVTEVDSKGGEGEPLVITKGKTNTYLIESSPGSGKTRMMGFMAKQAADLNGGASKHTPKNATKVLLLTPRLDLNRQTLHEFGEELGIKDKDVALFDSNQTAEEKERAKNAPILIATYQSLEKMLTDGTLSLDPKSPQYRGLVLMDEVHEIVPFRCTPKGSNQTATIASFMNDHQTTLLFTGTDDGVSLRHFGGNVPTIYSKRLVKAHNQGLTCETIHPGLIDVSTEAENTEELVASFSSRSHPNVVQAAVDAQLQAVHPSMGPLHGYKSLFFINGVDAGREGMEYFNKRAKELAETDPSYINPVTSEPLKAAHIHADTPKEKRQKILKDG